MTKQQQQQRHRKIQYAKARRAGFSVSDSHIMSILSNEKMKKVIKDRRLHIYNISLKAGFSYEQSKKMSYWSLTRVNNAIKLKKK